MIWQNLRLWSWYLADINLFQSISITIAPIFGFFGRVGTNAWYSAVLLVTVVFYICAGAYVFRKFEAGQCIYCFFTAHITWRASETCKSIRCPKRIRSDPPTPRLTEADWEYSPQIKSAGYIFIAIVIPKKPRNCGSPVNTAAFCKKEYCMVFFP